MERNTSSTPAVERRGLRTADRRGTAAVTAVLRAAGGFLLGAFLGLLLTLALVVARAHVLRLFVHSVHDLVGPLGLPALVFPLVGAGVGMLRPAMLRRAAIGSLAGLFVGAALGAALGAAIGAHPTHVWAGGIVAGGVGAALAAVFAAWRGIPGDPGGGTDAHSRGPGGGSTREGPTTGATEVTGCEAGREGVHDLFVALLLLASLLPGAASCGGEPSDEGESPGAAQPAATSAAEQRIRDAPTSLEDTTRVESVVFLLGDPGEARARHYPILRRVRRDLERWAAGTALDGEIGLVVLGDILYPAGLHAADHSRRELDSIRLTDQIDLVSGPAARAAGACGWFVPGNHDWGHQGDFDDAVRVQRLDGFLRDRRRDTGVPVTLEPGADTGGPSIVDAGRHLRLVFLDTAWWLVKAQEEAKAGMLEGVERAIRGAGDRRVIVAAHHPFAASGPHGGHRDPLDGFGVEFLLSRSGALLQGINSPLYRDLRQGLLRVFSRVGRPDVFAGGHEHSLQVIRPSGPHDPLVSLVSGSASRLSPVRPTPESLFVRSAPGYVRVLVLRDGTLRLEVVAAPPRFRRCPDEATGAGRSGSEEHPAVDTTPPPAEVAACLRRGARAYRTVWAGEITPARRGDR